MGTPLLAGKLVESKRLDLAHTCFLVLDEVIMITQYVYPPSNMITRRNDGNMTSSFRRQ